MKHYQTIKPVSKQVTNTDLLKAIAYIFASFAVFVLLFAGETIVNNILKLIFKF